MFFTVTALISNFFFMYFFHSGSMNDIDVKSVNGVAYVAAGGKNVHNNDMGDGGDLYAITVQ